MSSLGAWIVGVVAYESLDHIRKIGQNCALLAYGNFQTFKVVSIKTDRVQCMRLFIHVLLTLKVNLAKISSTSHWEISACWTTHECNNVTQHSTPYTWLSNFLSTVYLCIYFIYFKICIYKVYTGVRTKGHNIPYKVQSPYPTPNP